MFLTRLQRAFSKRRLTQNSYQIQRKTLADEIRQASPASFDLTDVVAKRLTIKSQFARYVRAKNGGSLHAQWTHIAITAETRAVCPILNVHGNLSLLRVPLAGGSVYRESRQSPSAAKQINKRMETVMATVTDLTLSQTLRKWGILSSSEAWQQLDRDYPQVHEWLTERPDPPELLRDEFARLILLVLEAYSSTEKIDKCALASALETQHSYPTTRPANIQAFVELRSMEPELAALLAFFIREVRSKAMSSELSVCCLIYASLVSALSTLRKSKADPAKWEAMHHSFRSNTAVRNPEVIYA